MCSCVPIPTEASRRSTSGSAPSTRPDFSNQFPRRSPATWESPKEAIGPRPSLGQSYLAPPKKEVSAARELAGRTEGHLPAAASQKGKIDGALASRKSSQWSQSHDPHELEASW
jgi:hypothetical protein